jgi:hypothetical protein
VITSRSLRNGAARWPAKMAATNKCLAQTNKSPDGVTYLSDISLKVMCEKQRTSTFSHHRRVKRLI